MTPIDASMRFLTHCRVGRNLADNSLKAYRTDLREFLAFLEKRDPPRTTADAISPDDLRDYSRHLLDDRGLKQSTVRRRLASVRSMCSWLEREGQFPASPFRRLDLRIRVPEQIPRDLNASEVRKLLIHLYAVAGFPEVRRITPLPANLKAAHFRALTTLTSVEILLSTGLRISELCNLELRHVDLSSGTFTVMGKGSRVRCVFLTEPNIRALCRRYTKARATRPAATDRLLVTTRGAPASDQHVRRLITRAAASAGLPRRITPHMLRHSCATALLEAGLDVRFVQRLLGHRSILTTQLYAHVHDASLKRALERAAPNSPWGFER